MDKKFDKVSVIGSAICIAVMVALFFYNQNTARQRAAAQAEQQAATQNQAPVTVQDSAAPVSPIAVTEAQENVVKNESVLAPEFQNMEPMHLGRSGEYDAIFDPAVCTAISKVVLNQFTVQTDKEDEKNDLVELGSGAYPFLKLENRNNANGVLQCTNLVQDGNRIIKTSTSPDGSLIYTETWTVDEQNDYEIKYTLTVKNTGANTAHINRMALSCGSLPAFVSRKKQTYLSGNAGFVAYGVPGKTKPKKLLDKHIQKLSSKPEKQAELDNAAANWVAVSSKYFLFALRHPQLTMTDAAGNSRIFANCFSGVDARVAIEDLQHADNKLFVGAGWIPEYNLVPGEEATFSADAYCGPKNYIRLQEMGEGIDSIMDMNLFFFWNFAWMGWISRILLAGMVWFAGIFGPHGGYGLGIICVTLIVKLIFMPLSYRSTRSMHKMQLIQPQLKELRERFKDDPQRMYHEQQKLFKENNVSQMGGCLPMLAQIPVFFAMFNTFRSAIEIRNASFLWIADLSMPDDIFGLPIRPLALLTGITMLFQQKLTPSPDPNQAKMMTIMSLVFVVFFYNMPAALTLYMTVNQITSIIQMLIFRRLEKKKDVIVVK